MIRICEPDISDIEEDYVLEALRQNELSGHGKHVRQFEQKFADFLGAKHAIMVPNGTVSLHLVLAAFGVKAGDEVIIPSQTISSCAFACAYLGATVVVVDVDPNTFCMDVKALRKAITRKTKAIMPVHMFGGVPCEMDTIMNIARENGISVLEDAAAHRCYENAAQLERS
jgi:perosamine synthetase